MDAYVSAVGRWLLFLASLFLALSLLPIPGFNFNVNLAWQVAGILALVAGLIDVMARR